VHMQRLVLHRLQLLAHLLVLRLPTSSRASESLQWSRLVLTD
jgi:hypothetical protein